MEKATRTRRRELDRAATRRAEDHARGLLDDSAGRPLATLEAITRQREHLATLELDAVTRLREGSSPWSVIGRALGITGQAAAKRYRGLLDEA